MKLIEILKQSLILLGFVFISLAISYVIAVIYIDWEYPHSKRMGMDAFINQLDINSAITPTQAWEKRASFKLCEKDEPANYATYCSKDSFTLDMVGFTKGQRCGVTYANEASLFVVCDNGWGVIMEFQKDANGTVQVIGHGIT